MAGAVKAAQPFTPGDLLVTRDIGGAVDTTLSPTPGTVAPIATPTALGGFGLAATVVIDEYTPGGTLVQSITLPNVEQTDTTAGNSYALTFSGTQNNEGTIELSGNGKYFTLIGYNRTAGQGGSGNVGTNAEESTTIQRVVGLISMDGSVNTTTGLQDVSSKQSPRSAYTTNGKDLWVGGSSGSNATIGGNNVVTQGVHYTTIGSTTSTQITLGNTNQRILSAYNFGSGPQLFLSSNSATNQTANATTGVLSTVFRGIGTVGTGLPTTPDADPVTLNPVQLPGFENTNEPAAHETADNYWFKDKNTLYIADQRNTGSTGGAQGGLQKWTFQDTNTDGVPDSWVFDYNTTFGLGVLNPDTGTQNNVGAHGLSGWVDPTTGNVDLYVTTFDGAGANSTQLYQVIDNGTAFANTLLATSDPHSAFRGVAVVPYYNLLGDANNDAKVDLTDLSIVLNHFGEATPLKSDGNFDDAATIDLTDLSAVLNNFGRSVSTPTATHAIAAPEPTSLALLGVGVAGVLMRRRRA
ncbi:MAG: PEP-CTERM sorting domain-containing protein [Phycisphaerae bacterium]